MDEHTECIAWLGHAHAEAALTESSCSHCESISFELPHSWIAFFKEHNSTSHSLAHVGPVLACLSLPSASLNHKVLFTRNDQCPSSGASGMVSFGGSEEGFDDTVSLMEIKDTDKTALLDSPISPLGLFGSAVDGFPECFTTA